jgi:hypothetical protein
LLILSDKQRRTALKKNIAHARDMARRMLADGVEEVTLTYYADEGSFRAMKLPEKGNDFEHRQRSNAEIAKVMLARGLDLKVQVLNAEEYLRGSGHGCTPTEPYRSTLAVGTSPGTRPRHCSASTKARPARDQ